LEEKRSDRYVDTAEMGLGTLDSNIDHVARLGRESLANCTGKIDWRCERFRSAEKCKNWQVKKSEWQTIFVWN
jgi:hypothetical protein